MDRMGVSGTLDIGSIPIRATKNSFEQICVINYSLPSLLKK